MRRFFLAAMDGGHAENAGAFFGGARNGTTSSKRRPFLAGPTPKLQEQISAGAWTARHPENEIILVPEMQVQFPAAASWHNTLERSESFRHR